MRVGAKLVDKLAARKNSARQPALVEVLAVWGLYILDAAAIFSTYANASSAEVRSAARFDPARGAAQVLVFVRHPWLPAAIATVPIALCRLPARDLPPALGSGVAAGGTAGAFLAAAAARRRVPPSRSELVAVTGVGFALGATVGSARAAGIGRADHWTDGDGARIAAAAGLVVPALPWILADLGISITDVPVLGSLFLGRQRLPPGATHAAVHLGHHHGMDGVLLALTGLTLSRPLRRVRPPLVREALSLYLAALLVYGVARAAEDVWNEQVIKRGWTSRKIPLIVAGGRPVHPGLWATALLAADALHRRWFRRREDGAVVRGPSMGHPVRPGPP